jgi:hypothetical protein
VKIVDETNIKQIVMHLGAIEKMLAYLIVQDLETVKDKIICFHKVGIARSTISDFLGVTVNHVDVTLSNARKAGEI